MNDQLLSAAPKAHYLDRLKGHETNLRPVPLLLGPINRYQLPAALFDGKTVWPISLPPFKPAVLF